MKGTIKSFHDLEVWKISHQLTLDIYALTKNFPNDEKFRLVSQITRAAASVPTNIAQGMGRYSRKEFIDFLTISRGSTEECKYLLILSKDLLYLSEEQFVQFLDKYDLLGKKQMH